MNPTAPGHVTAARVLSRRTGAQPSRVSPGMTRPSLSSTSARSSPPAAATLTNRCFPRKVTGRVTREPSRSPAPIEAKPSRRNTARPVVETPEAGDPFTPARPLT